VKNCLPKAERSDKKKDEDEYVWHVYFMCILSAVVIVELSALFDA
jgi:hypothetical protein